MSGRKGITNFEFVLAIFVFLSSMSFVSITIINNVPNIHMNSIGDETKTTTYFISQMLLFDKGYPVSWDTTNVERFGLSSGEHYILDPQKIADFNTVCINDPDRIRNMIGPFFELNISKLDGNKVLYCNVGKPPIEFTLKRHAVYNGEIVNVEIVAA